MTPLIGDGSVAAHANYFKNIKGKIGGSFGKNGEVKHERGLVIQHEHGLVIQHERGLVVKHVFPL